MTRPRFLTIINTDWVALLGIIMTPIMWLVVVPYHYLREGGEIDEAFIAWVVLPITILGAVLVIWRVRRIYWLFNYGQTAIGRIDDVYMFRDRGRIEFDFEYDGRELKSWMPIHLTAAVLELLPDQEVELLVDPRNPRNAIIKHLFL